MRHRGLQHEPEAIAGLSQRTIRQKVMCSGVGLHCGATTAVTLLPAPPDAGITFVRVDLEPAVEIQARPEHVVDTSFATTLGAGGVRIGTVEHLLAALSGLGIDNVRVQVDGSELPIMDGSAEPFVQLLASAGIEVQRRHKRFLVMRRPVVVRDGDKLARLAPARRLAVSATVDFSHPLISNQHLHLEMTDGVFVREVARSRTFGFLRDVEALRKAGLAKGGSLENAIVVDDFSILNSEGLRFPDEFVRHKILDAVGDLSLLGMPVIGHFECVKTGHALNHRLVKRVLCDPSCHEVLAAGAEDFERLDLPIPALSPVAA